MSSIQRRQLHFIREFDKRELWAREGCRHMGQWLAGRLGVSVSEGLRMTGAAHALAELPLISAALDEGTLSLAKVLQLARFATPESEKELIRYARRASVNALRLRADRACRPPIEDVRGAHDARYLQWWTCDDFGSVALEGRLPADQGAVVTKALDRVARRLPKETGDTDQRRADALAALASTHIAEDADADRATVVVHAPLSALQRLDEGCEIDGRVIHPEIARRLACDARLQIVLEDDHGTPLGIGHTERNVPPWLWRALLHRDHGCTFPGCGTRQWIQAHHVKFWPAGPTDLDNLVVLCKFHHDLVHEQGWRVRLDERHRAQWFRPDGTGYDPGPRIRAPLVEAPSLPTAVVPDDLGVGGDPERTLELVGFG